MRHKEYYTVKRLRLLEYLINKGFEVEATIPEPTNPRMKNWIFRNCDALEEAITEYFNKI